MAHSRAKASTSSRTELPQFLAADPLEENIASNPFNFDRKFNTESDFIQPIPYFTKVADIYNQIKESLESYPSDNTAVSLLSYTGEPHQFEFDATVNRKEIATMLNRFNANKQNNDLLASVKARKAQTNKDTLQLYRKYTAVEFTKERTVPTNIVYKDKGYDPLYVFKIYMPFTEKARLESIRIQREVLITGIQTLNELASIIPCHLDSFGMIDKSSDPGRPMNPDDLTRANAQLFPDAFFFINNHFYCETDGVTAADSSIPYIKKFLENHGLKNCPVSPWKVQLNEIEWKVGKPYLYVHLGRCEHLVMLADIRLRSYTPHELKIKFPAVIAMSNAQPRGCMLCVTFYARWVVHECETLAVSEAYLCHRCFMSYCYNANGEKKCEFNAYEYIDPSIL